MSQNNNNNNKNKDISGNKNINHFFFNLHPSNRKKTSLFDKLLNDSSDNLQIDIKNNSLLFSMRFDSILDELRKNRTENENKLKDNSFDIIRDSLDKTEDDKNEKEYKINNNLELVPFNKKLYRSEVNKILKDIDDRYDLFFNNDLSKKIEKPPISKKNTANHNNKNIPQPPPPSSFFTNTNSHNAWNYQPTWPQDNRWSGNNACPPTNTTWPGNNKIQWPNLKPPTPPSPAKTLITSIPHPIKIKKKMVKIEREINGLSDILKLIDDFPMKMDVQYNINMQALHNIKKPLEDLNNMIGMNKLKDAIVDQIIFFSQNLHMGNDFMHTVIYGPPGTGKTEIAKIMGRIFSSIGILENNTFRKATRSDLIAGYLGQTAIKTRDVIKDCLGGVLFIDEAYALGNREKRDSFAKECIDTLCEGLSDNKDKLMVIIAGYEEDLDKCFFSYNQGLNSRFPWRFHTDDYKADELNKIFAKKVKEIGWSLKKEIKNSWFENKMDYFKFYGRDIETLLAKTKIAHGRRVFCKDESEKRVITQKDVDKGFSMFTDNKEVKNRADKQSFVPFMYT